jgi:hypothetical protein
MSSVVHGNRDPCGQSRSAGTRPVVCLLGQTDAVTTCSAASANQTPESLNPTALQVRSLHATHTFSSSWRVLGRCKLPRGAVGERRVGSALARCMSGSPVRARSCRSIPRGSRRVAVDDSAHGSSRRATGPPPTWIAGRSRASVNQNGTSNSLFVGLATSFEVW